MSIARAGVILFILLGACAAPATSPWMDEVDRVGNERSKILVPADDGAARKPVYLVSQGWHTGIVVRRADLPTAVWPESEDFPGAEYLGVGWGDRDFYQSPEFSAWLAFKAIAWPTPSVLHVVGFSGPVASYYLHSEVVELELSQRGLEHLSGFIHDSFERHGAARSARLGPGLYGHSAFYLARGKFHLFNTCNVWTARVLRAAGLPVTPFFAITTDSVMSQARPFGMTIKSRPAGR